ncbi:hypothetical protein [Endozoicomonas sp. 8E]|uniref:hypothetical protein n=1 Tax=Endozoicomonas sp. 8E TaxID=3035692 RepID=UPI0029390016|nr:hypothetical protein [Endozoicomonas sp. 8E]WOG25889.1 hypothetical protein P6910_15050 [Endozoicomonas sp. 8E]
MKILHNLLILLVFGYVHYASAVSFQGKVHVNLQVVLHMAAIPTLLSIRPLLDILPEYIVDMHLPNMMPHIMGQLEPQVNTIIRENQFPETPLLSANIVNEITPPMILGGAVHNTQTKPIILQITFSFHLLVIEDHIVQVALDKEFISGVKKDLTKELSASEIDEQLVKNNVR